MTMVGQHLGRYRVLDRLGQGGMGAVYRAIDEVLARNVALKVLHAEHEDPQQRFRGEAIALARLSHPGIATVYELFQQDNHWVMVMELVRGRTLEQMIAEIGVFSPQRAAEICMQTLGALAHAHGAGVVHRDLKPSNVMITETGAVKILDFGIARLGGTIHLTHAGCLMGTPAYMAPEQVQGGDIDARADLYALGVILYRLITGQLPFRGETPFAMAQAHVNDSPTPIDRVRTDVPAWVHALVARALAKAPEQRFQSAREFHDGFARGLTGLSLASAGHDDGLTEVMVRRPPTRRTGQQTHPPSPPTPSMPTPLATHTPLQAWWPDALRISQNTVSAVRARRTVAWMAVAGAVISIGMVGSSVWPRWPQIPLSPHGSAVRAPSWDAPSAAVIGRRATAMVSTIPGTVEAGASGDARRHALALSEAGASAIFSDVKLLVANGSRTDDRDVRLNLSTDEFMAVPNSGGAPIARVAYDRIAKATYVHARDPQWDARLGAPKAPINVPGFLGRSRRWFVVQTTETYTILRLDGENWPDVLRTFEARAGLTIDRPLPSGQ